MSKPEEVIKKLEGKTIEKVWKERIKNCDDEPYLFLKMTDGTLFKIIAEYGRYTGGSDDEYPRFVEVEEIKKR